LPDKGNGQIAAFLAAAATAGIPLPLGEGITPVGNVIWFNAEDDVKDTIVPRLVAAGADLSKVHIVNSARVEGRDQMFNLITDLALLHRKIQNIGNVVLVIIDPMSAYLGIKKIDSHRTSDVRGILSPLKELTEELHLVTLGIAHFNKKDDVKSALLRVSDSIAWVAAPRHVYAVLDDPEDNNCRLFVRAKNNIGKPDKALKYGFGAKKVGYDNKLEKEIWAPYVEWMAHVDIAANDAMAAADGNSGFAKREAKEFLAERLAAGPASADDLVAEAEQNGITKRTLYRAKKELQVRSRRHGGTHGGWTWETHERAKVATGGASGNVGNL
jgi:hypothetical protein